MQAVARLSVSALVASLPLLYLSLLRRPPSALAGDTAFWFLMSNCVIAAIVAADDAGTLFFRSNNNKAADPWDDRGGGKDLAFAPGDQMPVVPFGASGDEPAAVSVEGGRVREEGATTMASSNSMDHAPPFLTLDDEKDQDSASKPSTGVNHASVLRPREEEVDIESSTDKSNSMVVLEGQGEEQEEVVVVDELAVIKDDDEADDRASAEPEPWPRLLTTTKSLVKEEAAADEDWPTITLHSRSADVPQDKSVAAGSDGSKLRPSAMTERIRPEAEEGGYWELSDEELNRRVEEFIVRFNREMRQQIEQEAGV